jgi:hypothetical protein
MQESVTQDRKSAEPRTNTFLWDKFQKWFKGEHLGDWSRRNQMPEWKAFQAGANAGREEEK